MPSSAHAQSNSGKPPAGVRISLRNPAQSAVGSAANNQSIKKAPVAVVDHGSEMAIAIAR
jgi:hypothetical protein